MKFTSLPPLGSALLAALILSLASCSDKAAQEWPALNMPAPDPEIEARIDDLIGKMSLEQKVGQVIQADTENITPEEVRQYRLGSVLSGGNSAPGDESFASAADWLAAADAYFEASIDPDGVEVAIPLIWGIDAVHGHAKLSGATIFPHNIGLGATGNPDLIEAIGAATASELTVSGHDWTFAPTVAVPRDDRWGRTYEGFSESPDLVAAYADRAVYGLQGRPGTDNFLGTFRMIASAKHFIGDGGTKGGVDQGNTLISEEELRDIHAPAYFSALEAGVQTVMASYNSWNGQKLHGHKYLLTTVLKERLGFNGFVIGDWNGHGQIPGCTNTDCPEAMLAGIDMYMAPDSWKGIYQSTLAAVQAGEIPMARLDDAVRRILRVKLQAGLFEKAKPSKRPFAGDLDLLGFVTHRDIARQAVRQSMVLLKNNNSVLPLSADQTVLVVGDAADSISKQSGGWSLSWQGGSYDNSYYPNGESIFNGIENTVAASGGQAFLDPTGTMDIEADVVIAVYGENPYAEYQGDRDHLDYQSDLFDVSNLRKYREAGIPIVSIFLSGRPLWVNPELNASDAFIAAWLPGTEGSGVADLLFRTEASYDFTGKLPFSWPASAVDFDNNVGGDEYAPLFGFGYGLSYATPGEALPVLSEESGLPLAGPLTGNGAVFRKGGTVLPWKTFLIDQTEAGIFNGTSANLEALSASRTDYQIQEDALALNFMSDTAALLFIPDGASVDWSAEFEQGQVLALAVKTDQETPLTLGMGCVDGIRCAAEQTMTLPAGDWREVYLSLNCFSESVDLSQIDRPIMIKAKAGVQLALADLRLEADIQAVPACSS